MTRRTRRKPLPDHRVDCRGKGWVGIPQVVIDSDAYRSLSALARAILVEVVRRFNGYNNGEIAISQRELSANLGMQNFGRISRAIGDLVRVGLIEIALEGSLRPRKAREFRLTFVSTGKDGHYVAATNDYLGWGANKIWP